MLDGCDFQPDRIFADDRGVQAAARAFHIVRTGCDGRLADVKEQAAGLGLGLPLAVGAGRLLSAQLYGVKFWDPLALGVAAVSLALCAFVAAMIPAARAATISPMNALRAE